MAHDQFTNIIVIVSYYDIIHPPAPYVIYVNPFISYSLGAVPAPRDPQPDQHQLDDDLLDPQPQPRQPVPGLLQRQHRRQIHWGIPHDFLQKSIRKVPNVLYCSSKLISRIVENNLTTTFVTSEDLSPIVIFAVPHCVCLVVLVLLWPALCCCCTCPGSRIRLCRIASGLRLLQEET